MGNTLKPVKNLKEALKRAKHRAFLAYKPYRFMVAGRVEPLYRLAHRVIPPTFRPELWPDLPFAHNEPLSRSTTEPVPRRIYVLWTGPNEMSTNRREALQSIRDLNSNLDVVLVTDDCVQQYVLPEYPLHPAYQYLSYIHRSDYLSCYLLHFYGGGYADLKRALNNWSGTFDAMDASDYWMAGYRVPVRLMTPNMPDPELEKCMRKFSEQRLGQTAYITRPNTPLTSEWWRALNLHLDMRLSDLRENPGNARGDNPNYPLHLNEILAQIVDPIQVKYRNHILYDQRLFMDHTNYI